MFLRLTSWLRNRKLGLWDLQVPPLTDLFCGEYFFPTKHLVSEPPFPPNAGGTKSRDSEAGELRQSYLLTTECRKSQSLLQPDALFRIKFYLVQRLSRLFFMFIVYHIYMYGNTFKLAFLGSYSITAPNALFICSI